MYQIHRLFHILPCLALPPESNSEDWGTLPSQGQMSHCMGPTLFLWKTSILKDFDVLSVGINLEKDKIYPIIDKRVDEMISSGLENEVKTLINKNLTLENNSMNTIGYREMYSYLKGEIDYERCVSLIKQHTRNYAKRQLTFMKSIKGIKIVSIEEARKLIEEFLN